MTRRKRAPASTRKRAPGLRRQAEPERFELKGAHMGRASFELVERGEPVEVVAGVTAYAHIDFAAALHNHGFDVYGHLVLGDPPSRYLLDRFTIARARGEIGFLNVMPAEMRERAARQLAARPPAPPVTSAGARTVPIEEVTGVVLRKYGAKSTFDELEYEDGYRLRDAGIGDESALRFVTGTYLTASLQGLAPASRVADRLECSLPTAGRWIAAAKDAGFLTVADTRRR